MEQQLRSALKGTQIKRVSGSDRYGTSTAVLKEFFSGQKVRRAFVATGIDYPDALSAAVPAGASQQAVGAVKWEMHSKAGGVVLDRGGGSQSVQCLFGWGARCVGTVGPEPDAMQLKVLS